MTLVSTTKGDSFKLPDAYLVEKMQKKLGRFPRPLCRPAGKRFLVFQDPAEDRRGSIYIPQTSERSFQATWGEIVAIGDGYEPEDPEWESWGETCPLKVGDRVMWGRYHGDCVARYDVEEEWWDSSEEKSSFQGKVELVLIHVKDVLNWRKASDQG